MKENRVDRTQKSLGVHIKKKSHLHQGILYTAQSAEGHLAGTVRKTKTTRSVSLHVNAGPAK